MKIGRLIAMAASLCLLMGVMPFAASAETTVDFANMAGHYKTQGRVTLNGTALEMDTSSSGFEFYFEGSGDVKLYGSFCARYTTNMFFTVIVDGVKTRQEVNLDKTGTFYGRTITLASGLSSGKHHIEFYKQTEASSAFVTARSLTFTGTLLSAPPADKITMEVVGDSITGGASLLANNSTANASYPVYQDGTLTYAYLCGEALGANIRVTQTSGYGCVSGWNQDGINLQDMYPYTSYWRSKTTLYDFNPPAEIVVINLGTNDYTSRDVRGLTGAAFKAGAKNLMTMARNKNPGAKIVWCTGMMGTFYKDILTAAISELGGASSGYYFCELPYGVSGGEGHPNAAQHAAAAVTLENFLLQNCLPSNYKLGFSTASDLQGAITAAKAVANPSAALTSAIADAEMELSVGTTDAYRLGVRKAALQAAMDGQLGVSLMPQKDTAVTPVESGSSVWVYYDAPDGSVTLYKAGDGYYWPHVNTLNTSLTIDLNATPYLNIRSEGTAELNVHMAVVDASGNQHYVTATDLAGVSTVNFAAGEVQASVDCKQAFAAYLDANGCVTLIGCDIYAVGTKDQYVKLYTCEFAGKPLSSSAVTPGDVNGDNKVTTSDSRVILASITGSVTLTDDQKKAADFNNDGKINTSDVRAMLSSIVTG